MIIFVSVIWLILTAGQVGLQRRIEVLERTVARLAELDEVRRRQP